MRTLVTGASGYIGRAVCARLLARGISVRALTRSPARLAGMPVELLAGDIRRPDDVDRAVRGIDVVVQAVGTFRGVGTSPHHHETVNVRALMDVIDAARRHRVRRVVLLSTVWIHGSAYGRAIREDSAVRPSGAYELSKAAGDALALAEATRGSPEIVIIRPAPVYGPGDTRLVNLFRLVGRSRAFQVGKLESHYQTVHIDDLAEAIALAVECPAAAGHAFIVGGDEQPSFGELVATVARAMGRPMPKTLHLPSGPVRVFAHACEFAGGSLGITAPIHRLGLDVFLSSRCYDISKAKRMLGYRPRISLEAGLAETLRWARAQGLA